ncbi:restriction endonuclease subunit S [uncultured Duncaniella sp.]|uniref:restriction endonuclease subunit S n=5 Tax=uncultured Duncaniella sp. TaxID=2768039 RepID=UPI00265A9CEA|nr:restriction endonuclease subunit S [uncultured Duncaniella sp.]
MSKLQELINRLCPNGVDYSKLIDVANVLYGFPFNSKEFTEDSNHIPLIRIRDVKPAKASTFYTGEYSEDYIIRRGDILVGMDGNFNLEKWNDRDGLLNQRVCKINSKNETIVLNGFLYHLLGPVFKAIEDELHSGTVIHLSAARINKLSIPVPPIEVQEEIVKILDCFADYAAELQAELQARKEQYEYYRNLLLTFNPSACGCGTDGEQKITDVTNWGGHSYEITWKAMGEIGKFIRGNGLQKKDFIDSGVGCIHYGQIYTHYGTFATDTKSFVSPEFAKKLRKAHYGDLIIATTSENVEDVGKAVAWLGKEEIAISGDSFIYTHSQNPKYIAYQLQTYRFLQYKRMNVSGTKVTRIDEKSLSKYIIPIPPIELQGKIVAILDRFETLVNDLTTGLPAEIAAVKEQYEYYRNKLLTFKALSA